MIYRTTQLLVVKPKEWRKVKEAFIQAAAPTEWFDYAEELYDNAQELLKYSGENTSIESFRTEITRRKSISRTYILLVSLALENAIKGYMISKNPKLINGGKLDKSLETHSILSLIEDKTDIPLSTSERKVCIAMQDSIPYWGRYPVPKRFEALKEEYLLDDNFISISRVLFEKIQKKAYISFRNGWDSGVGIVLNSSRNSKYEKINK